MGPLLTLALVKGLLIAFIVFAVTDSVAATLIISICSSVITGTFLIANTIIQHTLNRRDLEARQERVLDSIQELRTAVTQPDEA